MLQQKIRDHECELLWSAVMDFENSRNPFEEHMHAIYEWRKLASVSVMSDTGVAQLAREAMSCGIAEFDALHVASAVTGKADIFVSTDDKLIKRVRQFGRIKAFFPVEAVAFLENWYED